MNNLARQSAKTRESSKLGDGSQTNKSNIIVGAFGRESETPKKQISLGEAGNNIAGPLKRMLENQTELKPANNSQPQSNPYKEVLEDFPEETLGKETASEENLLQIESLVQEEEETEKQEKFLEIIKSELKKINVHATDEEALGLLNSNFKIKFPWLMFIFCFFYDFGNLIMGVTSIFLSMTIPPIGFMFMFIQLIEGIIFTLFFFLWANHYAKEASDFTKKVPMIRRFIIRNLFRRFWIVLIQDIPYIGKVLPVNTFMAYYTFNYLDKIGLKVKQSTQKASNESGIVN